MCGGCGKAFRPRSRSHIKRTAVLRPVSACDGNAGNRRSGRAMPTTARTRPGPSAPGCGAIATTSASIGAPTHCERNRKAARGRQPDRRRAAQFAKMDASRSFPRLRSGTHRIAPVTVGEFAKMDAWIVEMTLISKPYEEAGEVCKERT